MKKKIFNIIIVLAIIIGAVGASTVYAAASKQTKSITTNNNTTNTVVNEANDTVTAEAVTTTNAQETVNTTTTATTEENSNSGLSNHDVGLLAAALATGLACIGAGIAVAMVASSAIGAISEDPSLLGKTIIFAGLAEGIAIYGLIISIMILNKV